MCGSNGCELVFMAKDEVEAALLIDLNSTIILKRLERNLVFEKKILILSFLTRFFAVMCQSKIREIAHLVKNEKCGKVQIVFYFSVNFEHGQVDPNAIEKYQAKMKIGMPENVELKENLDFKGPQLKVQIETDHLTYSSCAKTLKGSGFRYDPYYATYIGIRDKTDGTMKLYEVDQVTVAANVEAPNTKNPTLLMAKELEQETDEAKKRAAAKKHLVTEFGQTKGQRMYAQADRMAVADEDLASKLSKAADNVDLVDISLPNNPADDPNPTANLTPPCNRQAGRKEEVYNIHDILSIQEIQALQNCVPDVAKQYEEGGISLKGKKKAITGFLEHELKQFKTDQNTDKLALAIYVDGIFQFLNMKGNHFSAGPRGLPDHIPIFLRQKIFDNFTDEG